MDSVYKTESSDEAVRNAIITRTSLIGIFSNIIIAISKIVIGIVSSSVAIVSDGVHGITDSFNSFLVLVGFKLSKKKPNEKHPHGYGMVEYFVSLLISFLILMTGFEVFIGSVDKVFNSAELKISYLSLIVVGATAVLKFLLGRYTINKGKASECVALIGVGTENKNDAFASVVTLISSLIYLCFGISIDAYAGIFTAIVILKSGFDVLRETILEIFDFKKCSEFERIIVGEINDYERVNGISDVQVYTDAPNIYSGRATLELCDKCSLCEAVDIAEKVKNDIMAKYQVSMTLGITLKENI